MKGYHAFDAAIAILELKDLARAIGSAALYEDCTRRDTMQKRTAFARWWLRSGRAIRIPDATLAGRWQMSFRYIDVLPVRRSRGGR